MKTIRLPIDGRVITIDLCYFNLNLCISLYLFISNNVGILLLIILSLSSDSENLALFIVEK